MLIDKIKDYVESTQQEHKGTVFRCSNAFKCNRALAYKKLGFEQLPLKYRSILTMEFGNQIETLIMKYAEQVGLHSRQKEVNVLLPSGLMLYGHIDGLIALEDELCVIDIKSINTKGFQRVKRTLQPDLSYIGQLNLYMHALKLKTGVLCYFDRDTMAACEVQVHYDPSIIADIDRRFNIVKDATVENLPDREYQAGKDWVCSYCAYNNTCYPDYEINLKEGKPKLVKKEEVSND